jgi:2-methylcitrate dehydratase PrpD
MTDNLGNPYHIVKPGLDLKKYPCCFGNQWSLDALIPLLKEHQIAYEDIECVIVVTPASQAFLDRTDPQTEIECKFSLPYVIGATILDGKPVIDTFHEPRIFSQRQRDAMKIIKIIHSKPASVGTADWESNVTVKLKNGKEYKKSVDFPTPLSLDNIVAKYRENAQLVLPPQQVERSLEIMLNLEKLEDTTLLMDALMA